MADPMRIRATAKDGGVNVKVLMAHEMEDRPAQGQRRQAHTRPLHPACQRKLARQGSAVGDLGTRDSEEPVSRVQFQRRQERRQDSDHLDRQQGR